jgi:hypothetical protein
MHDLICGFNEGRFLGMETDLSSSSQVPAVASRMFSDYSATGVAGRLVMHNLALLVVAGLRVCLLVCCSLALRFVQSARVQQGKHCQSFTSLKVLG